MASEDPRENHRPWSWKKFSIALGLFPLSFVMWFVGMGAVFSQDPHPILAACFLASPFVAIAGALWLVFLLVRSFTRGRRGTLLITGALFLAALAMFCGIAAFVSPPRSETEARVFAVMSGTLFVAALCCARYASITPPPWLPKK